MFLMSEVSIQCRQRFFNTNPFNRELYRTAQLSIQEQLLRSNEKQFRGGLVFKARGRVYHSTLGRE